MILDVNTNANIILTAKLERLNRSAFPSAVRSTLNDAAFEMKKKNILESAKLNMTVRNPAFFRKYTGVKRASGFSVKGMYSEVGFSPINELKSRKALEGMESNEVGGADNDGAMYVGKTRGSRGLVKRSERFKKGNLATGYKNAKKGKSNMMRLVSSKMENKPVFINTKNGRFLVKVNSISSGRKDKKVDIKLDFLMRHRKKHTAHARATHFNKEAAIRTSKQMEGFYNKNATFQFNKVLRSTR
jgi:hypothetical protein